jgi:hypothetical protein
MVGFLRNASMATLMLLVPGMALAQPAQPAAAPPPAAPTAGGANTAPTPAPAAGATAAPQPPKIPATGYGYGGAPAKPRSTQIGAAPRTTVHRPRPRVTGPVATFPGFEMLPDGSSRLFVQLTQSVPVEEKKAAGSITYVLKGAHVLKRNNQNALVTVHFNTPASRARLIPVGNDLHFVVDLRANVQPQFKMDSAKDNTALLFIDFPKGDFIPNAPSTPSALVTPAAASPQPGESTQTTPPETTDGSPP